MTNILVTPKKRIIQFINNQRISKANFYKKTNLKRGLLDTDKLDKSISDVFITKILVSFPELNPEWLLTGQGEMLKNKKIPDQIGATSIPDIETLKSQLKDKDKIIELLENKVFTLEKELEQYRAPSTKLNKGA